MADVRNGYELCTPLTTAQSGTAQWCLARRDGRIWFFKEFLSPVYPPGDIEMAPRVRERKVLAFNTFLQQKIELYKLLNTADSGNLIVAKNLFRLGNKLYAVSEFVPSSDVPFATLHTLPAAALRALVRTIVFNVLCLHRSGIVHADLKPNNILLKKTSVDFLTAKLIDFDNSFLESAPPADHETFMMDPVYMAPEALLFAQGRDVRLDRNLDTFSLGVLLHEVLTGRLPDFNTRSCHYVYEAVLKQERVILAGSLPRREQLLLEAMLSVNPAARPDLKTVFESLSPATDSPPADAPAQGMAPPVPHPEGSAIVRGLYRAGNL